MPSVILASVTNKPFMLSVMLTVIYADLYMLSVIMLNVGMLSVIMLNVVTPSGEISSPMQSFQNALAYFATVVSYLHKMFMKSAPVANVIRLFTAVSYNFS
jgi:hypothetical protein